MQNTHIRRQLRLLHGALLDIVSAMNRSQRDEALLRAAGVQLDRALFPLLVGIERLGPIGVVDLAERVGRDYTTVSRQVARLETLGLAARRAAPDDRRVRQAAITAKGKAMTQAIDAARERMAGAILETWAPEDLDALVRLMGKLADALSASDDRPDAPEAD